MKKPEAVPRPGRGRRALAFLGLSGLLAGGALLAVTEGTSAAPQRGAVPAIASGLGAAKIALADRDHALCERLLRELLASQPDSSEAKILLGRVLLLRGRLKESADLFAAILKGDPRNLEATRGQGAAYLGMGQLDLGILFLRKATEIDPKNPEVWKDLGLAEREKGDALAALSSLQQSLSLDRDQADLTQLLSELATGRPSPAPSLAGVPRMSPHDPYSLRPIDPANLVPTPRVPDPTQHFPKPGGGRR